MLVSLIAAMGRGRVIGLGNALPWRLPADMRRFREITMGKPVVMGRKTYESIGKPLSGRRNVILSRNPDFLAPGCLVVGSLDDALSHCQTVDEVMVIGGADCYTQALHSAGRMYLTYIDEVFEGDQFFPEFADKHWQEEGREAHRSDQKNPYDYCYVTFDRCGGWAP